MPNFENDISPSAVTDEIIATAQLLYTKELDIKSIEETLARLKKDRDKIKNIDLPELMSASNLTELGLDNGAKIIVKPDVAITVKKENQPKAYAWLIKHGHQDVIKTEFKLAFGKGEIDEAEEFEDIVRSGGYDYTSKESVHASTMKALIKGELEKGVSVPADIFGIFEYSNTIIKMP